VIAPQVESMAEMHRNVIFLKIDVDQLQEISVMNQVRAMPTFLFFKNGAKIAQFEGADSSRLQNMVLQYDTFENVLVKQAKELLDNQKSLAFAQNLDCLKTIRSLLSNVVSHPQEEKYRSIRTTNPAIEKRLGSAPGAFQFLEAVGFERQGENLVLSKDKNVKDQYQDILELLDQKQNHVSRTAQMLLKDKQDEEKKRKELEDRKTKIREEKKRQMEEKQKLTLQTKMDHKDGNL